MYTYVYIYIYKFTAYDFLPLLLLLLIIILLLVIHMIEKIASNNNKQNSNNHNSLVVRKEQNILPISSLHNMFPYSVLVPSKSKLKPSRLILGITGATGWLIGVIGILLVSTSLNA